MATAPYTDMYRLPFPESRFGDRFGIVNDAHPTPHRGTDFVIEEGTRIPSVAAGMVVAVQWSDVLGIVTVTATRLKQLHQGSRTLYIGYCHQRQSLVKVGQTVKRGAVVGLSGTTGSASTGPHLHLTMSFESVGAVFAGTVFDPIPFIRAHDHLN